MTTVNRIDAPGTAEATWRDWLGHQRFPAANLTGLDSAVVLAAHPDDEVLGAGGTIALMAAAGVRLRLIAVTDGERSHPEHADRAALAELRTAETARALCTLGADVIEVIRLRLPDTGLAGMRSELAATLAELGRGFSLCLAPWEHDAHADHEATGQAARLAGLLPVFYPVWTWHWAGPADPAVPWRRACVVPLPPAVAARKQAAIGCFASQLEPRGASLGPVLPPEMTAHFDRPQELFFR